MIPSIIHQSWKTSQIPAQYEPYTRTWRQLHAKWEYRFWTDEDNLRLLKTEYAWLLPTYQAYPLGIQRADMARVLYMHKFGGLYVDLDFECFRPFDTLIAQSVVFMGREQGGLGWYKRRKDFVCNALLASPPGHPFWELVLRLMVERARPQHWWEPRTSFVLATTGPEVLDAATTEFAEDEVKVYPSDHFYPASVLEKNPDTRRRLAHAKNSHAVHHFSNSWFSSQMHMLTWIGSKLRTLYFRTPIIGQSLD